MTDNEFRLAMQRITSCALTNEAFGALFDALEDIEKERLELLQRIEAAEKNEEITRKTSRKFEAFYYGERDRLRNENTRLQMAIRCYIDAREYVLTACMPTSEDAKRARIETQKWLTMLKTIAQEECGDE